MAGIHVDSDIRQVQTLDHLNYQLRIRKRLPRRPRIVAGLHRQPHAVAPGEFRNAPDHLHITGKVHIGAQIRQVADHDLTAERGAHLRLMLLNFQIGVQRVAYVEVFGVGAPGIEPVLSGPPPDHFRLARGDPGHMGELQRADPFRIDRVLFQQPLVVGNGIEHFVSSWIGEYGVASDSALHRFAPRFVFSVFLPR